MLPAFFVLPSYLIQVMGLDGMLAPGKERVFVVTVPDLNPFLKAQKIPKELRGPELGGTALGKSAIILASTRRKLKG